MGNKKKWKRTLPVLLAALLWAEGTLGTVCASESVIQGLSAEGKETMSGENADICEETTADSVPVVATLRLCHSVNSMVHTQSCLG